MKATELRTKTKEELNALVKSIKKDIEEVMQHILKGKEKNIKAAKREIKKKRRKIAGGSLASQHRKMASSRFYQGKKNKKVEQRCKYQKACAGRSGKSAEDMLILYARLSASGNKSPFPFFAKISPRRGISSSNARCWSSAIAR